ncbi:hypothetical protein [Paenibacillus sp. YN15]|uniref:hypothetical protein n=1 Tax=Paenibacillus sp. YN15 TaxID=1742774 RepID=UPI0011BF1454|nr:hypothetical protein [Paenibacillus sp. YN15]
MMKVLGWLVKMAVAAVFIAAVTIYATWAAVGTYLEKVLAHYQIGGDMQSIGFLDFVEKMGAGLNIMNQTVSAKDDKPVYGGSGLTPVGSAGSGSGADTQPPANANGSVSGGTGTGGNISSREEKEGSTNSGASGSGGMADALPVWSQSGSSQGSQSGGTGEQASEKMLFSADFLSSTKDTMTNDDKIKLFALVVSKLPAAEVQAISQLMENGITQEELAQLDGIIRKHLTQEEYTQVLAILEKYQ